MSQSQILYINFRNSEAWISQLCISFMIGLVSLCHLYFHVSSNIISLISSRGEASLLIGMSIKSEDHFFECACATPKSGSWVRLFPLNASFISFSDTFFHCNAPPNTIKYNLNLLILSQTLFLTLFQHSYFHWLLYTVIPSKFCVCVCARMHVCAYMCMWGMIKIFFR